MRSLSHNTPPRERCTILGVDFFVGPGTEAVALGMDGGLTVVPAAPALLELATNCEYREAVRQADLVITDSGFMVLIWRLLTGERLRRTSGLRYLKLLLASSRMPPIHETIWIMPSLSAARRCLRWLNRGGRAATLDQFYIAPCYMAGPVHDPMLLEFVRTARPSQILLGLGGGTQEKVGLYLKRNLDWRPGIHCIGGAIGFLTGDQTNIPDWADRWLLGWLLRCLDQPFRFVPRYFRGGKLAWLLWKYRDLCPELQPEA